MSSWFTAGWFRLSRVEMSTDRQRFTDRSMPGVACVGLLLIATLAANDRAYALECPTSIHFYRSIGAGDMVMQYVELFHKTSALAYPPATRIPIVNGHVMTPRLSLPTPLASHDDLRRLSHGDWQKIKAFQRYIREAWQRSRVSARDNHPEALDGLFSEEYDRVIDCHLAQTQPQG